MTTVKKILFIILISELIVGGGGRLLAFGPISLRMILFSLAMVVTGVELLHGKRVPSELSRFVFLFLASLGVATLIGILSGAPLANLIEDVKPLLYILILPFFYFALSDLPDVSVIRMLIIAGAVIMSMAFLLILSAIHSGLVPFLEFYDRVIGTKEFFFRGETTFFYKGFIYLCLAIVFAYFSDIRFRTIIIALLGFVIVLTFTRGFLLALAMTWLLYSLLERKYVNLTAGISALVLIVFLAKPMIYHLSTVVHTLKGYDERVVPKTQLLGNRDESDSGRLEQIREVLAHVTPASVVVGHGFGNGIPSRPVHMEISYAEIFHKQGLIGLSIWAYLFLLIFRKFTQCKQEPDAKAYFYSVSLLFFQSITNQFINNPIGLSFALLSLVLLDHMRFKDQPNQEKALRHQKGDEISATNF